MMKFSNQLFPVDISYGMAGGPEYSTDVVVTRSGLEQRNCNWARPKYRYNVAYGVRTKEQLDRLIIFFRNHKGKAIGFRFKDWTDYTAEKQPLRKLSNNSYQLIKNYDLDQRIISKIVKESLVIKQNGKKITNYTLDDQTGVVTFAQDLKDNIEASFEFHLCVRFDTDRLVSTIESYGVYSWQDIPLVELL